MNRKLLLAGCTIVIIAVASTIWFSTRALGNQQTHQVRRKTLEILAHGVGKVECVNTPVKLSFRIPGRVKAILVDEGQRVQKGQALASLTTESLDLEVEVAESELDEAKAQKQIVSRKARPEEIRQWEEKLARAQLAARDAALRLKRLEQPPAPPPAPKWQLDQAELRVKRSQQEYQEALQSQRRIEAGPTKHELAAALKKVTVAEVDFEEARSVYNVTVKKNPSSYDGARKAVEKVRIVASLDRAKKNLELERAKYEMLRQGATPEEKAGARAKTAASAIVLDGARAKLKRLANPPKPPKAAKWRIDLASNELARNQSRLREISHGLTLLKAGPLPEALEAAEAEVRKAELALNRARLQRDEAMLRAPCDGVVASRDCEPGASLAAHKPIIVLADVTRLRVRAELDVRFSPELSVGQTVRLKNAKLFETPLSGRIVQLIDTVGPRTLFADDPGEISGGEVITVLVETDESKKSPKVLRGGLRIDVEVEFGNRENVVAIPRAFVSTRDGRYVVYRAEGMNGDQPTNSTPVEVQLGFRDDTHVEIISGLAEGDYLVQPPAAQR